MREGEVQLWRCPNHGLLERSAAMGSPQKCPIAVDDGKPCGNPLLGPFECKTPYLIWGLPIFNRDEWLYLRDLIEEQMIRDDGPDRDPFLGKLAGDIQYLLAINCEHEFVTTDQRLGGMCIHCGQKENDD